MSTVKCMSDSLRRKYTMYDVYHNTTIICERKHTHAYAKCTMIYSSPTGIVNGKSMDSSWAQYYWDHLDKYHKC